LDCEGGLPSIRIPRVTCQTPEAGPEEKRETLGMEKEKRKGRDAHCVRWVPQGSEIMYGTEGTSVKRGKNDKMTTEVRKYP